MRVRGRTFEVNRSEGKLLGVCAGLADTTGIDATIIRIGMVVATIVGGFPWTLIAYGVLAFVGQPRRRHYPGADRLSAREESRDRMRNLDLRMQAIETYVTSSNSRLAREIEDLR
jgi:phage shock protein C